MSENLVEYILEQFESCALVEALPRQKWSDYNAVERYSDELFHVKLPRRYDRLASLLRLVLDPDDWRVSKE